MARVTFRVSNAKGKALSRKRPKGSKAPKRGGKRF